MHYLQDAEVRTYLAALATVALVVCAILYAFARTFAKEVRRDDGALNKEQMEFLEELHDIFGHLSSRMDNVGKGDAHLNGIVILHSLAVLFGLSAPELIRALSLTPRARLDDD